MDRYICLQPLEESHGDRVQTDLLEQLSRDLALVFGLRCKIAPPLLLLEMAYLPIRGQYLAADILADLKSFRYQGVDRVLAITNSDLCADGLNFVFGQAELGGRFGIISTHRLRASTSIGDDSLFYGRVLKEAIHELGHTFGLSHCHDLLCIMHFSNTLEDTDLKGPGFCTDCTARLTERTQGAIHR